MARQTTIISIFLASPSDVLEERKLVVRSIERWNAIRGKSQGYMLELLSWETATSSAIGLDGQHVVNSQIGDEYDAMIALFWHRTGSPTPRAVSGATEEYGRALERHKEGQSIEIGVYFKSANPPFGDIDPDQLKGVMQLKERMQADGVYHKSFLDDDGLSFKIDLFLDNLVRAHHAGKIGAQNTVIPKHDADTTVVINPAELPDEELGYLDLIESITAHSDRLTKLLRGSSVKLEEITAATRMGE